jgi:hypothetical protein
MTFDEFVLFHKAVKAALSVDPEALATIRGLKHDFGWNLLGNLLDLGGLAFAPATPEVNAFVAHMSASHEFFDDLFIGVYESEVRGRVLTGWFCEPGLCWCCGLVLVLCSGWGLGWYWYWC